MSGAEPAPIPPGQIANDMIIDDYRNLAPWREKFIRWQTLQKSCPAAAGPAGTYCRYGGHNCAYIFCVFRIFEEERIVPEKVPLPPIPQKISIRLDQMQGQIDAIQKQIMPQPTAPPVAA